MALALHIHNFKIAKDARPGTKSGKSGHEKLLISIFIRY